MAVWSDNVRIFDSAIACGILAASQGEQLKHCYITLRNQIHQLNLLNKAPVVSADTFWHERQAVIQQWQQLFATTGETYAKS